MINVIIPVHNRVKYTIQCIESLHNQDCEDKLKIFIINDGSTDETKKIINDKYPEVNILEGNGTLFWGGAVNYGITKVLKICHKDDWILLVNNDVELKTNALSNLLNKAKIYKRKGIFSSLSVSFKDKKTIIKSGTIVKSWFLNLTSHKFVGQNIYSIKSDEPVNVDFVTGRCLLHPVEIFDQVMNYNSELFPHYGADDEFSMRVKKYGYSVILCPSSIVYLKENNNSDFNKKTFFKKLFHNFFSQKSSSNIINKFNLTLKVVPLYAKTTFFLVGVLKSLLICLFK